MYGMKVRPIILNTMITSSNRNLFPYALFVPQLYDMLWHVGKIAVISLLRMGLQHKLHWIWIMLENHQWNVPCSALGHCQQYYCPMKWWAIFTAVLPFANTASKTEGPGIASQGLYSLRRSCLISIGIPIINLRRSSDSLRFIMGIPIPTRGRLLSE